MPSARFARKKSDSTVSEIQQFSEGFKQANICFGLLTVCGSGFGFKFQAVFFERQPRTYSDRN
jgi:hypothetical protein